MLGGGIGCHFHTDVVGLMYHTYNIPASQFTQHIEVNSVINYHFLEKVD